MSHLTFKFSAMGGTKTRQLQAVHYNFKHDCALFPYVVKPATDNRDGHDIIRSRDGNEIKVDLVATKITDIYREVKNIGEVVPDIILIDEVQFLHKNQIIQLRRIVDELGIPVIAYGIKSDAFNEPFEGSKYLFVYADKFEQLKTICRTCTSTAIMNMRTFNGRPIFTGQQVMVGSDESYVPVCSKCYSKHKKLVKEGFYDRQREG